MVKVVSQLSNTMKAIATHKQNMANVTQALEKALVVADVHAENQNEIVAKAEAVLADYVEAAKFSSVNSSYALEAMRLILTAYDRASNKTDTLTLAWGIRDVLVELHHVGVEEVYLERVENAMCELLTVRSICGTGIGSVMYINHVFHMAVSAIRSHVNRRGEIDTDAPVAIACKSEDAWMLTGAEEVLNNLYSKLEELTNVQYIVDVE